MALKELWASPASHLLIVLNIFLGSVGFLGIHAVKDSIESALKSNAKELLGADLSISVRRSFSQEESDKIGRALPPNAQESELIEFNAMASAAAQNSRLVQVRAIDSHFPFYGSIRLDRRSDANALQSDAIAWAYPELLAQMKVRVGDSIRVGAKDFKIVATIKEDSAAGKSLSFIAPRIYIGRPFVGATELVRVGSTYTTSKLYQIGVNFKADQYRLKIEQALDDTTIQVDDFSSASQQMARGLQYLGDYLGLASLVALVLAVLGLSFLVQVFLAQKNKEMAILLSLGLRPNQVLGLVLIELMLLLVAGIALAYAAADFMLIPLFGHLLEQYSPFSFPLFISIKSLGACVLLSCSSLILVALPLLIKVRGLQAAKLFSESFKTEFKIKMIDALWYGPLVLEFAVISLLLANSYRVGGVFIGATVGALTAIALMGFLSLRVLPKLFRPKALFFRFALRNLERGGPGLLFCFVCLSLAALFTLLIPEIQTGLQQEFLISREADRPDYFLYDIQPDQVSALKDTLKAQGTELQSLSPLVRARILQVNGKKFELESGKKANTREEEEEQRFRNRGVNLSFATGPSLPKAGLSVERQYAERFSWKLGDTVGFDVQGVAVEGTINEFRHVNWASFRPNFFILVSPGVLDEAPKTFLATVKGLKDLDAIVRRFSNIAIVDIVQTVKKITALVERIAWAFRVMALLCLVVGMSVLYSIGLSEARTRRLDLNILRALGFRDRKLGLGLAWELGLIGLGASFLGGLGSLGLSFLLSHFIFEQKWVFIAWPIGIALLVFPALCGFIGYWVVLRLPQQVSFDD